MGVSGVKYSCNVDTFDHTQKERQVAFSICKQNQIVLSSIPAQNLVHSNTWKKAMFKNMENPFGPISLFLNFFWRRVGFLSSLFSILCSLFSSLFFSITFYLILLTFYSFSRILCLTFFSSLSCFFSLFFKFEFFHFPVPFLLV